MRATCAALSVPAICRWSCAASSACDGQRGRARVGHQVHARRLARLRVDGRRHAVLADERADAEVLVRRVLRVGHGPRTPVDRDGGRRAVQPVAGIRVAAARIAHDFNRELRVDARAVRSLRRPRQRDPEQTAIEQLRVRTGIVGRQVGTVHAVHGRKQRVLAAGGRPPLSNAAHRQRHAVGRLVARDAGAAVRADGLEERMPLRAERTGRVQHAELALLVVVHRELRQRRPLPRTPPRRRRPGAAATKTAESHTARSVDCHLIIGSYYPVRKWDARSKNRSNLAVVKKLTAHEVSSPSISLRAAPATRARHNADPSCSGHLSLRAVNHSSSRSFQESTGSPRRVIPKPALT